MERPSRGLCRSPLFTGMTLQGRIPSVAKYMKGFSMRVIHSEVLYQGRLKFVRDTLEYSDGRRHAFEVVVHPGAVVILPLADSGKIVFVEQYRHALGRRCLELPAGTLEAGEPPEVCAERELMEEIGKAPGVLIPMGRLYPAPGFCSEEQHLFCAQNLRDQKATPDEDEAITTVELSISEIERAVQDGSLSDAKSLALLFRAKLSGYI